MGADRTAAAALAGAVARAEAGAGPVRWQRRPELHDAFLSLASSLICWRRLKKTGS